MKTTIRASHKNGNKPASAQSEKRSIRGQNTATIGQIESRIKGKVTIGAIQVGVAIGLSEDEIKALALMADWENSTPGDYSKGAVLQLMDTTVDIIAAAANPNASFLPKNASRVREKAQAILPVIAKLLPLPSWKNPRAAACFKEALKYCTIQK